MAQTSELVLASASEITDVVDSLQAPATGHEKDGKEEEWGLKHKHKHQHKAQSREQRGTGMGKQLLGWEREGVRLELRSGVNRTGQRAAKGEKLKG